MLTWFGIVRSVDLLRWESRKPHINCFVHAGTVGLIIMSPVTKGDLIPLFSVIFPGFLRNLVSGLSRLEGELG